MDAGFGGICIKIPTAIQTPSNLYYVVFDGSYRLFYHMKTWAPSPLSYPPIERGGRGNELHRYGTDVTSSGSACVDADRNAFAIRSSRIRPWLSERSSSLPRRRSTWRSAMACLFRRRSDDKARLSAIRSWHTSSAPAEVRTPRCTSSATSSC